MPALGKFRLHALPAVGVVVGTGLLAVALFGGWGERAAPDRPPAFVQSPVAASGVSAPPPGTARGKALSPPNPAAQTAPPVRLNLPTLNVQAAIQPVVTTRGVLGVPDDPAEVGWWVGSARPGAAAGSVVIDGHVDSAVRGIGALFHLVQLQSGDTVSVTSATGGQWTYRVFARQMYSKHQPLPADLFATAGPPRLVLITCGGAFDSATGSYEDNVVVLASPQSRR